MNTTKTELFQNEQEYYRALTVWVRNLTAAYGEARTKAAGEEGRLLRRNGGLIVSREELLSLLKPEEEAFEAGELLEEFRQIRDRGQKTIREGELIVMEYLFRVLELTEFETYLAVVALACELDHELALAVGYLNEQTGIRVPTLNLCLRMYTGDQAERLRLLQRCLICRKSAWERNGRFPMVSRSWL